MRLIASESLILSLFGAIIGIALGLLATEAMTHWRRTAGLVQGDISPRAIAEGAAVAIVIAMIGTAYPAWRSLRLPIAQTLRAS